MNTETAGNDLETLEKSINELEEQNPTCNA